MRSTNLSRTVAGLLATMTVAACQSKPATHTDANRDLCVRVADEAGTTTEHCQPYDQMLHDYTRPLLVPIKADDQWTENPAAVYEGHALLIPAQPKDATGTRQDHRLVVERDSQSVTFQLDRADGFVVVTEHGTYEVTLVPALEGYERQRVLGNMVVELITGTSVNGEPFVPWFADEGRDILGPDGQPIEKKKGIWKSVWDKVPKPVKRAVAVVGGVGAAIGAAMSFYANEEDCMANLQALCTNEALKECPKKIPPGTELTGIEWPQIDQDGDGTPDNYYGTCDWTWFPSHGKWGYRPSCATPTCKWRCKGGGDGNCENPECQHENPGLCCQEQPMLCDEQVGCQLVEVDCESSETGDCGGSDSECYES